MKKITQAQRENDYEVEQPRGVRLGHMGHLTLLSTVLQNTYKQKEILRDDATIVDFMESEDWLEFATKTLLETRERDSAILGGVRPEKDIDSETEEANIAYMEAVPTREKMDMGKEGDQLARYMIHQITSRLPDFSGIDVQPEADDSTESDSENADEDWTA